MPSTSIEGCHWIDPNEVTVEARWRSADPAFIEELAQSFIAVGQLQPIIVKPVPDGDGDGYILLDGLHRLSAAKLNGDSQIGAVFNHEMDAIQQREIELEANIKRLDMKWQERELARAELHKMRMASDPDWTQRRTAQLTGTSQARVADSLKYAKMVQIFPELEQAKSARQAFSWMSHKAKTALRTKEVADTPEVYASIEECILLGDAVEIIKHVPDGTFHAVITDPPFGIKLDTRKAGEASSSTYDDDTTAYEHLLTMIPDLYRVLRKDAWLIWFLGPTWYERCKLTFREAGFTVDEMPIIWNRSDGKCYTARPDRYFARGYDMALHCLKGEPEMIVRGKPNVITVPPLTSSEKELFVERPVELYAELIRRLTIPGEIVADFFVGSGSCPAAAASLGRKYFGTELDPGRRAAAIQKISAYTGD